MATLIKSNGIIIEDYDASTVDKIKEAVGGYAMYISVGNDNIVACNDEGLLMGLSPNAQASLIAGMQVLGDALLINKFELR
jgi:hypothetical protein